MSQILPPDDRLDRPSRQHAHLTLRVEHRHGSLVPGPEVAHRSGWHDMKHAVTAMQLPDGRRFVFAEENFYGRPLLYKGF